MVLRTSAPLLARRSRADLPTNGMRFAPFIFRAGPIALSHTLSVCLSNLSLSVYLPMYTCMSPLQILLTDAVTHSPCLVPARRLTHPRMLGSEQRDESRACSPTSEDDSDSEMVLARCMGLLFFFFFVEYRSPYVRGAMVSNHCDLATNCIDILLVD